MELSDTYKPCLSKFWPVCKIIICVSILLSNNVIAKPDLSSKEILEQYQKILKQQQKGFDEQQRIITKQGKEIEKLKSRLDALTTKTSKPKSASTNKPSSRIVTTKKGITKKTKKSSVLPAKPVGKAPPKTDEDKRPPEIPRIDENIGGVLTHKGNLVIEPSLQYSFISNNRAFLNAFTFTPVALGLIDIREIKRHSVIGSLTARYGLTERIELSFRVPYVYRTDNQRSRPVAIAIGNDNIFKANGNDIGDLEFSARYQFNDAGGRWPVFIGNIVTTIPTGKSPFDIEFVSKQETPGALFPTELPTGSGYYSFQPSISALYTTDPAVFFANVSYNYNLETNENIGKFDPGNAVGASFGMGFALNDTSSFSLGYSHRHVNNSENNGEKIIGSSLDIGELLLGYSYKITPKSAINLSVTVGATSDAQDVRLKLRLPITFDLFSKNSNKSTF
jgi:hypothetical protein